MCFQSYLGWGLSKFCFGRERSVLCGRGILRLEHHYKDIRLHLSTKQGDALTRMF